MANLRKLRLLVLGTLLMALIASMPMLVSAQPQLSGGRSLDPHTQFYVPKANHGAVVQINQLKTHNKAEANLLKAMIDTPQALWFTKGSPKSIKKDVQKIVESAQHEHSVPILVAYNVPGRDCAQYSAGGAATGNDYKAWVDGFVAGLGQHKVVVIVEPDGLALLPTDCGQPDTYNRVSLINYAAHAMLRDPNAAVYLDAGHSSWHNIGDIASRLVAGGVKDVQGFYLNPSNYQFSPNLVQYGSWISKCIAYATSVNPGDFGNCPNQYWNGGPLPSKIAQLLGE